ncbi:MAG: phage tail tape measure protein [Sedimentisphaerales bacterium]
MNTGAIKAGRAYVEIFVDKNPLIRGLRSAEKSLRSWGTTVSAMGRRTMLAGASIVGALAGASIKAAAMGDTLSDMATKTGMSVEALSGFSYVASQTEGSIEDVAKGIRFMQRSIFEAGKGTKTAAEALGQLGLTAKDLNSMSPDRQFIELADRIGLLKNPTDRAALAMKIFGKAGTELLPMFAKGKGGINALIEEAKRLGLIMSTQDAEAASIFHDELKKLTAIMKMGLFRVGAALIPILADMADKIVAVVAKITEWIKINKGVVVMALYIGAGITAAGAAFYALGLAMTFSAKILSVVLGAFAILKTVLLFILSPLGMIVTALTAGVGAFLYFSGYGGKLLSWLGERFVELKQDATKAFNGISQALAKGDITLAAQILWLTLKMEFLKGKQVLLEIWLSFKNKFLEYWNGIGYSMVLVWDTAVYGIKVAWIETVAFLKTAWIGFKAVFANVSDWCIKKLMGIYIWWQKLLNPKFDDAFAKGYVDDQLAQGKADREAENNKAYSEIEKSRTDSRAAAKGVYQNNVDTTAGAYANDLAANDKEAADRLAAVGAELDKAKSQWQTSLAKAAEPAAGKAPALPKVMPKFSDTVAAGGATAVGTFSASGLSGLGAGGVMQKIAAASQETAKNTAEIADNTADGGEEFE